MKMNAKLRYLTLVRHAKSSWDFPHLADHDRPLNKRGQRAAPDMARRLATRKPSIDLILSSSAVRARTTAEVFADSLQLRAEQNQIEESLYGCSASSLLDRVREFSDHLFSVMLVGHNPELHQFAEMLQPKLIDHFPTCTVATVSFAVSRWQEIEPELGQLEYFDFPKNK